MAIKFRDAKLEDKERDEVVTLLKYCYDESPQALEHFKNWWEVIYKEHYVGTVKGEIKVSLRSIPFLQNIRGVFKKTSGVGMVATYPEERRKGYYRGLMKYAYEKMKEEDILASTLTPFKDSFYMQFGFINAKPAQFIEINPFWFSKWKNMPEGYSYKRMRITEGVKELRECHEHTVSQFNGGVKRYDIRWEELTKGNPSWLVVVYNPKKEVEGAMSYAIKGYGDKVFGENNVGTISRVRFYPKTLQAKHVLFHFIYLHAEQLVKAAFQVLPNQNNFQSWIQDHIKTEIKQHFISMVRIVNVNTIFDDISVPEVNYGDISIEVQDPMCEWNNGILKLEEDGGKLVSKFYPNESVDAKIAIEGLSALLYGTLTVEEAEYFGWMNNITFEDKEVLSLWFPEENTIAPNFSNQQIIVFLTITTEYT